MMPATGLIDTAARFGPAVYGAPETDTVSNQYAAMPSLHIGWAAVIAVGLVLTSRARWRWLWLLHPVTTFAVVVATANHYWMDGVVVLMLLAVTVLLLRPPAPDAPPGTSRRLRAQRLQQLGDRLQLLVQQQDRLARPRHVQRRRQRALQIARRVVAHVRAPLPEPLDDQPGHLARAAAAQVLVLVDDDAAERPRQRTRGLADQLVGPVARQRHRGDARGPQRRWTNAPTAATAAGLCA